MGDQKIQQSTCYGQLPINLNVGQRGYVFRFGWGALQVGNIHKQLWIGLYVKIT